MGAVDDLGTTSNSMWITCEVTWKSVAISMLLEELGMLKIDFVFGWFFVVDDEYSISLKRF